MIRLLFNVIVNSIKLKKINMPLGRWCHPNYTYKCNSDIKSHLATIDNSSNLTGLCIK